MPPLIQMHPIAPVHQYHQTQPYHNYYPASICANKHITIKGSPTTYHKTLCTPNNLYRESEEIDSDSEEDSKSSKTDSEKGRHTNHSEIEKRRRDKMNMHIQEIASQLPSCTSIGRRHDKITVLRHALAHIRNTTESCSSSTASCPKPTCLTEIDLTEILDEISSDKFQMVICCETGNIVSVCQKFTANTGWLSHEVVGMSIFDMVRDKDADVIRDQMQMVDADDFAEETESADSVSSTVPFYDTTHPPLSQQRIFACALKHKQRWTSSTNVETDVNNYVTIQCMAYIKRDSWNWPSLNPQSPCSNSDRSSSVIVCSCKSISALTQNCPDEVSTIKLQLDTEGIITQFDDSGLRYEALEKGKFYSSLLQPSDRFKFERDLESQLQAQARIAQTIYTWKHQSQRMLVSWKAIINPFTSSIHSLILTHNPVHQ